MVIVNGRCKHVVIFMSPGLDPVSKVPHRDTEEAFPAPKHWQSEYEMKFKMDADKRIDT